MKRSVKNISIKIILILSAISCLQNKTPKNDQKALTRASTYFCNAIINGKRQILETSRALGYNGESLKKFFDVYARAGATKNEIDKIAKDLAIAAQGKVATAPIKSVDRSLEKVAKDMNFDASEITDLARNTIVVKPTKFEFIQDKLSELGAKVSVVEGSSNPLGYSGIKSIYTTKVGNPGEIQVNSERMIFAKETPEVAEKILGGKNAYQEVKRAIEEEAGRNIEGGKGHLLYEEWRSLSETDPRRDVIAEESITYYNMIRGEGDLSLAQNTYTINDLKRKLESGDAYISYDLMNVKYRRVKGGTDKNTILIYQKFNDKQGSEILVSYDNELYNEAILFGKIISKEEF